MKGDSLSLGEGVYVYVLGWLVCFVGEGQFLMCEEGCRRIGQTKAFAGP